jgi:hypothetical protein
MSGGMSKHLQYFWPLSEITFQNDTHWQRYIRIFQKKTPYMIFLKILPRLEIKVPVRFFFVAACS